MFTHGCFYLQVKSDLQRMSRKTLEDLGSTTLFPALYFQPQAQIVPCGCLHTPPHFTFPCTLFYKVYLASGLGPLLQKLPLTSPGISFWLPFFYHYNHCTVRELSASVNSLILALLIPWRRWQRHHCIPGSARHTADAPYLQDVLDWKASVALWIPRSFEFCNTNFVYNNWNTCKS